MPDRFWVGGTASWDGTAGTKWSATSGGPGGASVPTTADDVFFDANSTGPCFLAAGNTGAKSINCTGFTGTILGSANITVAGSVTLVAGMGYFHSGTVTITGTGTLTTAGKTFSGVTVDGVGITVTLGDALNTANRNVTVTRGTFDTANFAVTAGSLSSSNTNTRTITLGSSTVTLSSSLNFAVAPNLTFNAGTSQINLTASTAQLLGGGRTFHNVSFTSTTAQTRSILGANTFNNLTLNASSTGMSQLAIGANQTVNGTFTCAGSSAIARAFVRSDTIGTTRTITAAAVSATDCDFRDITIAGAAAPISPTRGGDCGGNSGITFPAAKTVYWNLAGSNNWNATAWATTPSGSPAINNFPLAQDTAAFTNSGSAGTVSFSFSFNTGNIDASARTSAMTLSHNTQAVIYGSYALGSGVTVSGTSTQFFSGRGTQTFTSAGKTITFPITVDAPGGTFELGDAIVSSASGGITLTRGTFDAKNYNVTCVIFISNSGVTRTLTMGAGLWTLSGASTLWDVGSSNLTLNKDTADILLSNTTTSARTFAGGGRSYNKLTIGGATGTSILAITGLNSFTELASTKTVAHTVRFSANQNTIDTWSITGTAGNVVTVNSSSTGTRRTFNLTNVTSGIDYLAVRDIGINQANRFYVGTNSTDNGNNLNVIFTDPPAAGVTITPDASTIGLNGGAATLTAVATIAPDAGLLGLSGQQTSFDAAATLAADSGDLGLSGGAATLSTGVLLSPDASTLGLVGGEATLTANASLAADPASVGLDGGTTAFAATATLAGNAGALGLVGGTASLAANTAFAPNAGSLNLVGGAAPINALAQLFAVASALGLTGSDTTFDGSATFLSDGGTITLAGSNAVLGATTPFVADNAAINLVGGTVTFGIALDERSIYADEIKLAMIEANTFLDLNRDVIADEVMQALASDEVNRSAIDEQVKAALLEVSAELRSII
jgi:hypothetical protein